MTTRTEGDRIARQRDDHPPWSVAFYRPLALIALVSANGRFLFPTTSLHHLQFDKDGGMASLSGATPSQIAETRAFFGPRAATWEVKFPDDEPAFQNAVHASGVRTGHTVLDAACGSGRALPILRDAVGPNGHVIGIDITSEMLHYAAERGLNLDASLVLCDVGVLPFSDGSFEVIFAAGIITHLTNPIAGLQEFARVTRTSGRLAIFHPLGRTALANRHGHELDPDDIRGETQLRNVLSLSGWNLASIDDADDRYLAIAERSATII